MSKIKRYEPQGYRDILEEAKHNQGEVIQVMLRADDGHYMLFFDHESDCQDRIAEAVVAAVERCRREEVEPLMRAARPMLAALTKSEKLIVWRTLDATIQSVLLIQKQAPASDTRADRLREVEQAVVTALREATAELRAHEDSCECEQGFMCALHAVIAQCRTALDAYEQAKEGL